MILRLPWLGRLFGSEARRARREAMASGLASAREALAGGRPEAALESLRRVLRDARESEQAPLIALLRDVLSALCDNVSAELVGRAADAPHDPVRWFELGSHLLSHDAPDLAETFLMRAIALAPFDALVRSELALARAHLGRPGAVVETLAMHPCLADDPGALFQFGWSSMLTGDLEAAERACAELRGRGTAAAPLVSRFELALARARVPHASEPPDARDFLFVEHASVLLCPSTEAGARGRFDSVTIDAALASRVVSSARAALAIVFDDPSALRFLAADGASHALASELARACGGADAALLGPGRAARSVVVALAPSALEPVADRLGAPTETLTFALSLDWARRSAIVPDLVGLLARDARLDWTAPLLAPPPGDEMRVLERFVRARRTRLAPRGAVERSAYVPDAPLGPR